MSRAFRPIAISGGAALGACAVCCAPLILPMLVGLVAAGGLAWAAAGTVGVLILAVVFVGVALYRRRAAPGGPAPSGRACSCKVDDLHTPAAGGVPASAALPPPAPSVAGDRSQLRRAVSTVEARASGCGAATPDSRTKGG